MLFNVLIIDVTSGVHTRGIFYSSSPIDPFQHRSGSASPREEVVSEDDSQEVFRKSAFSSGLLAHEFVRPLRDVPFC